MPTPLEKAREYLDALEADRQAALALSEQKAEDTSLMHTGRRSRAVRSGFHYSRPLGPRESIRIGPKLGSFLPTWSYVFTGTMVPASIGRVGSNFVVKGPQ